MQFTKLFTLFGIPVGIHWSYLLIAALAVLGGIPWVLLVLMLSVFVLAHEFGHALTARRYGIQTHSISLHSLGGVAMIEPPQVYDPWVEGKIAAAGPATSAALGLVSLGGFAATGSPLLWIAAYINIALAVFNLLPIYPMDGGRVLHAVLAHWKGLGEAGRYCRTTSIVGGGALMVLAIIYQWWIAALIMGLLVFMALGNAQENAGRTIGRIALGVLTILALSGCPSKSNDAPTTSRSYITIDTAGEKPHQREAEQYIRQQVEQRRGVDLNNTTTKIYWTTTKCPDDDSGLTAVVDSRNNKCYHGLTFSCREIYVAWRGTIGRSAYAHELGHCYRLVLGMGGDGKHEDTSWWKMMQEINSEVRNRDW